MSVALLSIDLAKNIFQLHGVDERGHQVLSRRVSRNKLLEAVVCLPCCRIVMEACGGAHYWARRFSAMGHCVQIIAPRFVKPFEKSRKTIATMQRRSSKLHPVRPCATSPSQRPAAGYPIHASDPQPAHA
ncbi:transposase [Caballeronia arvi]|uniref:Transposase n=1 Tax=Caballeronia arvi TaxID=1777135 RepID=A0A158L785_9BURK|nr:transposase [Caballeronia arvi]